MTRIVAGTARGRRLRVPKDGTRPTADRVREAMFASLDHLLGGFAGRRVLDLFAGSGALGLEAASRGADQVVLVERNRAVAALIRQNATVVGAPGVRVVAAGVTGYLAGPPEPFDLVLADPPYATAAVEVAAILARLADGWLAPGAVVVVERASRDPELAWPAGYESVRHSTYGETTLWYGRSADAREATMRRAVCPGSFDPVTNGHLDVFLRAAALFDEVTVAVLVNKKKTSMFSVEERMGLLAAELADVPNIRIDSFHGLIVDYCRTQQISAIVRGLRAITDFDYELQMAQMNHSLAGIETLFVTTNPVYSYLSSSLIKEVATYGGDVSGLIPARVHQALMAKLAQ